MNTLIIYDSTGYIITWGEGIREPVGISFIMVNVPLGKRIKNGIGVNVSVTPNIAILEDIPKTEIELIQDTQSQVVLSLVAGGLM